ncbi:F-actin-capping protein subunit beta [Histomonas meleagridis]|uniref:F-actin-capping protein subunit beta n=1 Tax=Histomonas meleagridis TaxID=135588 RepID=UPI00355AC586|nr:F-actin-capping protein subunit beta [Histomonas meleagridis]KAH0804621.1 F-actin-capping protein subunit beta [Histomonas meleagridis]
MSYKTQSEAAHDLLRHVQPKDIERKMKQVCSLNPELIDDLFSTVDIPLQIETDPVSHRQFIKCDYNRDCDSFRSPFSNQYIPPLPDGIVPPPNLRKIEEMAQNGFEAYKKLYFVEGVLSVYTWEISEDTFGIGVFVRKDIDSTLRDNTRISGSINSSDVIEVTSKPDGTFVYDMISSILLQCDLGTGLGEPITLSGGISDHKSMYGKARNELEHLINVGQLIEENAANFMDKVKYIYVGKMEEIFSYSKASPTASEEIREKQRMLAESLNEKFGGK